MNKRTDGITRVRMSNAERAKIFIPFNPLRGFQEALRAKEAEMDGLFDTNVAFNPNSEDGTDDMPIEPTEQD